MSSSVAQTPLARKIVEEAYEFRAKNGISDELRGKIAAALGYKPSDFNGDAAAANIGEGCGNPLLIANLKEVCSKYVNNKSII